MNQKEQDNKTSQSISDTAVPEVTPPTAPPSPPKSTELSNDDLEAVSGGTAGVKKTMATQV
jgi:hypothetical protein